jgi:hypothetical protein
MFDLLLIRATTLTLAAIALNNLQFALTGRPVVSDNLMTQGLFNRVYLASANTFTSRVKRVEPQTVAMPECVHISGDITYQESHYNLQDGLDHDLHHDLRFQPPPMLY